MWNRSMGKTILLVVKLYLSTHMICTDRYNDTLHCGNLLDKNNFTGFGALFWHCLGTEKW